jgi:hypothetical protein
MLMVGVIAAWIGLLLMHWASLSKETEAMTPGTLGVQRLRPSADSRGRHLYPRIIVVGKMQWSHARDPGCKTWPTNSSSGKWWTTIRRVASMRRTGLIS